jgi:peptidoglycan/xylan/chitin deacetylase (PgdA/CDA1 family)
MQLSPATLWACTLGVNGALWIALPPIRPLSSVLLAAHGAVLGWGIASIQSCFFGPVLLRNPQQPDSIALTFDDGPDAALTPDILKLLDEYNFCATFFVIGTRVQRHPKIVQETFNRGHAIGSHDWNHSPLSNLRTTAPLLRDMTMACDTIEGVIGKRPLLYRPPVGLTNPHTHRALRALSMHCVGWSKSGRERGNRSRSGVARIGGLGAGGEMVLLHDSLPREELKSEVLNALTELFDAIAARKLKTVTVAQLCGVNAYAPQ